MVISWIKGTFKNKTESYDERLLNEITQGLPRKHMQSIRLAYAIAARAHHGQIRDSGDPYVYHPLEVAHIIRQWMPDHEAIIAAILHDTLEDTELTEQEIKDQFGESVLHLIQGVTKLSALRFRNKDEMQAESFRNMLVAIGQDLRVILVKLADRLHNMRTLGSLSPARQYKISLETKTIYAPIALRLGLNKVATELLEHCFQYLHPWRYATLFKAHSLYQNSTEKMHDEIKAMIVHTLQEARIKSDVSGRFKMLSSIYSKMQQKSLKYQDVHDKEGFRILVDQWDDVYRVLGYIHRLFRPVPGLFKDYIAIPKSNGYQSLHTIVIGPHNNTMEIQIRTKNMHDEAEHGHANHWQYKHATQYGNDNTDRRYQWLQSLLHLHYEHENTHEFIDNVKLELFHDEIYVFSPKGEIMALPKNSTLVDYAFFIHSEKGLHFDHGLINGRHAKPDTKLHNGDRILIFTHEDKPNPELFLHVHTPRARSALRRYFKEQDSKIVDHTFKQMTEWCQLSSEDLTNALERYAQSSRISITETIIRVGLRQLHPYMIAHPKSVIFHHNHPWLQRATCCQPLPGDTIVSVGKQESFEVHRHDCKKIKDKHGHPVAWESNNNELWETKLYFDDSFSHHDVLTYCSKHHIDIVSNERIKEGWTVKALIPHVSSIDHHHIRR